jgi:hypothetical protein
MIVSRDLPASRDSDMSEYEIASLFYQIVETAHAALANYLTVVFAVLISIFLVGTRVDRSTWFALLGVYSFFSIGMINEIVSLYSDMVRLGWEMAEISAKTGTALTWHGMASSTADGPAWFIPITVGTMCSAAFLGSLFFFFRIRKQGGATSES